MQFKGKLIALSGIDGCGKTSIIKELIKYLSKKGEESRYVSGLESLVAWLVRELQ